jgi:hypothetical protein
LLWLFGDGVSWTTCPSLPQIVILPISDFQVASIIGMSHQHWAHNSSLIQMYYLSFPDEENDTQRD